ncbi:unnamed protein product [Closterium sp. NIES-64]|nr:unnamed protein product [Closterium sp. NIES-64]
MYLCAWGVHCKGGATAAAVAAAVAVGAARGGGGGERVGRGGGSGDAEEWGAMGERYGVGQKESGQREVEEERGETEQWRGAAAGMGGAEEEAHVEGRKEQCEQGRCGDGEGRESMLLRRLVPLSTAPSHTAPQDGGGGGGCMSAQFTWGMGRELGKKRRKRGGRKRREKGSFTKAGRRGKNQKGCQGVATQSHHHTITPSCHYAILPQCHRAIIIQGLSPHWLFPQWVLTSRAVREQLTWPYDSFNGVKRSQRRGRG